MVLHEEEAVTSLLSPDSRGRPAFFGHDAQKDSTRIFPCAPVFVGKLLLKLTEAKANTCFVYRKQCFNNQDVTVTEKMLVVDRVERRWYNG